MEFLVRDLCARLPYNVKVRYKNGNDFTLSPYHLDAMLCALSSENFVHENFVIYPYLRPMSNMTEEEKKKYIEYADYEIEETANGKHYEYYLKDFCGTPDDPSVNVNSVDWLYAHHFDIHNLIKSGLALEAPEGMYDVNEMLW